jgi:hypothetical protein
MKKILLAGVGLAIVAVAAGGFLIWRQSQKPEEKQTIAPPPSMKKVNELELGLQPFVALLPHPNPETCSGVDLVIEDLKNKESLAEYELEYTAGPLIQGVFGRRDFTQVANTHQPLEFGSCSKGKCKCDTNISGGSLTLTFTTPGEEYALKSDFSLYVVGEDEVFTSTDARFTVNPGRALAKGTPVIVMKTMGLPAPVEKEVIAGPYGVFAPQGVKPTGTLEVTLQTHEGGTFMYWDGNGWMTPKTMPRDDKYVIPVSSLGVAVLVK